MSSTSNKGSHSAHSLEIREWAISILSARSLEEKLFSPDHLTDFHPGTPIHWKEPNRPPNMHFQRRSRDEKLPPFQTHHIQDNVAACLHRFAGHELLAVEIMAHCLLAFPDAPKHFRRAVSNTLKEEQGHVRLYTTRMKEMGIELGDLPLFKHFWVHTPYMTSPTHYLSMMNLTFEQANLDFAPLYRESFTKGGDILSANLMNTIFEDEISHVSTGYHWLKKLCPEGKTTWQTWQEHIGPLLTPKRAKGFVFNKEGRKRAGLPSNWIDSLAAL